MKYILIIGDGMADNAVAELGSKTPLEYVDKPAIDALASAGTLGTVKTCPDGLPAGSDTGQMSIFGCDPALYYKGRAPLEAAASGIILSDGDIAYRCNMVTLEGGDMPFENRKIISHSAGSIEAEDSDTLISDLFADRTFSEKAKSAGMRVYPSGTFRHIAVQSGIVDDNPKLTPPHDHLGEEICPILPKGSANAETLLGLMRSAYEFLSAHPVNTRRLREGKLPANCVWFWAKGTAATLPSFYKQFGVTGAVISAVPLCRGIAVLTGLGAPEVEGATGVLDTNYAGKVAAVIETLKLHPFAAVHLEAPDECTHDGDLDGKLEAIRRIDDLIVRPITETMRIWEEPFRILLLSDHKTLTQTRGHDGTPVPYLIYDSRLDNNTGLRYTEADALSGPYIADGYTLIGKLFEDA